MAYDFRSTARKHGQAKYTVKTNGKKIVIKTLPLSNAPDDIVKAIQEVDGCTVSTEKEQNAPGTTGKGSVMFDGRVGVYVFANEVNQAAEALGEKKVIDVPKLD